MFHGKQRYYPIRARQITAERGLAKSMRSHMAACENRLHWRLDVYP